MSNFRSVRTVGNKPIVNEDGEFLFQVIGGVTFFADFAKRVCKCRICMGNILKGQQRIRSVTRSQIGFTNSKSGKPFYRYSHFYHIECITSRFLGIKVEPKCNYCDNPLVSGKDWWKHSCETCSPHVVRCICCSDVMKISSLEMAICKKCLKILDKAEKLQKQELQEARDMLEEFFVDINPE